MHEDHYPDFLSPSNLNTGDGEWPAYDEHSRFESASQEVAQHVEVAPEMARTAALSAMALACQGMVDVAFPNGNVVPTSLHLLTIAETGERKTTLENWFFNPIKRFQKDKKTESEHAQQAYQRQLKNWQTGEKILNKEWAKAFENEEPAEEIEQRQVKHDACKPQPPRTYQLIYENITPIALAYGLYENLPIACLVSSEAGNILEGKAMEDLPMLNSIWSGSSLDVTRRASPSFTLNDPRLTMALMAQPKVIDRFLEKRGEEAMDNGFLSRLLVIKPMSMIGKREGKGRAVDSATMDRFNQRVTTLLETSMDILAHEDRQRRVLAFTPSAKEHWRKINKTIEQAQAEHGKYFHTRGHGSKLMDNITRVAAIIHTFEGYEGDIDTPLLEYARQLCNGYSNHFIQYMAGNPEIVTLTNQLVRDIRRLGAGQQEGTYHFKKVMISQRGGGRHIRKPKNLNAAIKLLTQLGHLEEKSPGNFRFSETIIGNTKLHFKNGVDYYVDEILKYDEQELHVSGNGRYREFKQKPNISQHSH
jgi:hypothetical protein|tara:strand:- start:451 stop:2046 length:1596 start_codon:yes stop_codon:yes gene_type:complete